MKLCECGCGEPAPIATKTCRATHRVRGEPMRFVSGHNARRTPYDFVEDPDTGCWLWQRTLGRGGYGLMYRSGGMGLAHRFYYTDLVGPIPEGLSLDHLCRQRDCVNPGHLEPVTNAQNSRRGSNAKLTAADVAAIRAHNAGKRFYGRVELAERFGVSPYTIHDIRTGRSWAA